MKSVPYTDKQKKTLANLSKEDKKKLHCKKCGHFFCFPEKCGNKGRMCYKCYVYGHEAKNCPNVANSMITSIVCTVYQALKAK